MTMKKIEMLENIGFQWSPTSIRWNDMFDELKLYKAGNGDCNVPRFFKKNPKLGMWVHYQRQRRRYKKSKVGSYSSMTQQQRIEMLENIGFQWNVR